MKVSGNITAYIVKYSQDQVLKWRCTYNASNWILQIEAEHEFIHINSIFLS